MKAKKILVIDDRMPHPNYGTGFGRLYQILKTLGSQGLGYDVVFTPTQEVFDARTLDTLRRSLYIHFHRDLGISVCDNFEKLLSRHNHWDLVWIGRPSNFSALIGPVREFLPNVPVIYDSESIWDERERLKELYLGIERAVYNDMLLAQQADITLAVSNKECQEFRKYGAKAVVLSHALDLRPCGLIYSQRKDILFVGGSMAFGDPNEDALHYWSTEIWPSLHGILRCDTNVTGVLSSPRIRITDGLRFVGFVPTLADVYDQHRVFVAPHRIASGIPWKVHEAMAFGIPTVISGLLAEQLDVDDEECLVAETSEQFREQTERLYKDHLLWTAISKGGRRHVQSRCDPLRFQERIKTITELL